MKPALGRIIARTLAAALGGSLFGGCASSATSSAGDAGAPGCTPTTCAAAGKDCGTIADGCGNTLFCGACSQEAGAGGDGASTQDGGSGDGGVDGASPDAAADSGGGSFLSAPPGWAYSQLVWETQFGYAGMGTSPSSPNQGTFVQNGQPSPDNNVGFLNDWNFGIQQNQGGVWSRSGSDPYWGSSEGAQSGSYASGDCADYGFPGNVFQTTAGPNKSLFGGYTPQTFGSAGTGLTLFDHYVGGPQQLAIQSNGSTFYYEWTSGVINTEGKRFFPFGNATEFYMQVNAKMAGPNDGSWSAIWLLPDQDENGTGQEIDIQELDVDGPDRYAMVSHVQNPAVEIGHGKAGTTLDGNFHVYGCDVQSSTQTVTLYLDGAKVGTFTGGQVGARYFLILNASLSSGQASWESAEGFVPNSTADMEMDLSEIQVYQR